MQKIKKFKSEIAQFSQNKANFPPFFLLTFSSGGIPPPQIPPFLLSSGGTLSILLIFFYLHIHIIAHLKVKLEF